MLNTSTCRPLRTFTASVSGYVRRTSTRLRHAAALTNLRQASKWASCGRMFPPCCHQERLFNDAHRDNLYSFGDFVNARMTRANTVDTGGFVVTGRCYGWVPFRKSLTSKMVEPRGVEPLTFSLRTRRSTN